MWSDCITTGGKNARDYYQVAFGVLPKNIVVRHKCDNTYCKNLDHMETGTKGQDIKDQYDRGHRSIRGTKNPGSKLSEEDITKIKILSLKLTQKQIAYLFGVSQSTIHRLLSGQSYAT